jgi:hypothetical protein
VFDDFRVEVEQARADVGDAAAEYFEFLRVAAMGIRVAVHYSLRDREANRCRCDLHLYPEPGHDLPDQTRAFLMQMFDASLQNLKRLVEGAPALH